MSVSVNASLSRAAILGFLLMPFTAIGAVTSLTALPPTVQFQSVTNGTVKTASGISVLASGSGSANITISETSNGNWLTAFLSNNSITAGSAVPVTIEANPANLTVGGTYTGQVVVTTGSVSATFNVTFIIYQGTDIQLTPGGWAPSLQAGTSQTAVVGFMTDQPAGTSAAPTAPGKAAFGIMLSPSTTDGNNWLSSVQTSNFTFSVTVNTTGLASGTYSGAVAVSQPTTGNNIVGVPFNANFFVSLTVSGGGSSTGIDQTSLTFSLTAGAQPSQQTINVFSPGGASTYYTTATATTTGGNWLQAAPPSGATPAAVTVTAAPGLLAPGNYTGNVQITVSSAVYNVPVSLTLTATATLQAGAPSVALTAPQGGSCAPQTVSVQSSDSTLTLPFTVKTAVTTPTFGAWLTASPSSGVTPGSVAVSCNTAGLAAGNYSAVVTISSQDATNPAISIPVTLMESSSTSTVSNVQTISHIADGGGWRSTIILVNTDTVAAPYTVSFWEDTGGAGSGTGSVSFTPSLALGATSGVIPVGESVTIQTADANPATSLTTEGWAQVTSSQSIGGTAIFRFETTGQEAAVPLLTSGGTTLEIPYQVGNGLALGVALANPSITQTANITETVFDQNGNKLSSRTISVAPLSHFATNPPALNGLTGSGVLQYVSNVSVLGLGIRLNGQAFTSIDAVLPQPASTKTISHIADGGGWRSTIILVNTDTVQASYTVNFWKDTGGTGSGTGSAVYSPALALGAATGTIKVGGSVVIQTSDADPNNLTEGWAQVTSSQSIGGTAIFRLDTTGQEAAVPLLTSGGVSLEIPYQVGNGLALGVAISNPSATQTANITETVFDQNGNKLSSRAISVAPLSHFATNPPALNNLTGSGVVEYDSNVNIFALGIRLNGSAFTSIRAVYK